VDFKTIHRWVRRVWITFAIVVMATLFWSIEEHGVPPAMFESDAGLRITSTGYGRTFIPATVRPDALPLVFLPGGMVDPDAYVPLMRGIAETGVPVALVELPMRAAPTEQMRATLWMRIREARAEIAGNGAVALAGHSRGGMFAATFAADSPSEVAGLILIGTTHPRDRDLSGVTWPVLKVMGAADCVASLDDAKANASRLPPGTQWVEIAGGNHRQFGYYGWQLGDCAATITREEQHRQAIEAITPFLRRQDSGGV
jgi:pimeloyl-ACP methyl ester carboxylesterase